MAINEGDDVVIVTGADGLPVVGPVVAPTDGDPVAIALGADGLPIAVKTGSTVCTLPSVYITVTGDVTRYIKWCNREYNLPADSGKQYEVCPTYYWRSAGDVWSGTTANKDNTAGIWLRTANDIFGVGAEVYNATTVNIANLRFTAVEHLGFFRLRDPGNAFWFESMVAQAYDSDLYDTAFPSQTYFGKNDFYSNSLGWGANSLGLLVPSEPTIGAGGYWVKNYMLEGTMIQNGVTYSWTKGNNWPRLI